ncbi:MAG: lipoprotein [Bacillota bacterium]
MKKIIGIMILSLFVLALSACGLGEDDMDDIVDDNPIVDDDDNDDDNDNGDPNISEEEEAALTLTELYDGDLTFLANRMEAMDLDVAHEVETVFTVEYDNALTEETDTVLIETTERYLESAEGVIIQQTHVFFDNDVQMASLSMITDYQGNSMTIYVDISDVYTQLETMVDADLLDTFGIESGWAKFTFSDSMTNMLEVDLFSDFLRAVVVAQDPALDDLESVEDDIVTMLGVDKADANIELQLLFDTLFTFDLNAVIAHVYDIDIDLLIDGGIENIIEPDMLSMMTTYETELRDAGIPYDTYYDTLSTDGLFALLDSMTVDDANIVGNYLNMPL